MLQAVRNQLFSSGSQQAVDEAAKQRSDEAVSTLATHADGKGVGLKMLSSMGFGAEGLGLGRNAQVFCRASCGDGNQILYINFEQDVGESSSIIRCVLEDLWGMFA